MSKKRSNKDSYIQYGFTFTVDNDGIQKPQCLLCSKVFSNGCMKPSKLQDHLRALHPENAEVPQSVFDTKRGRFELSGTLDVHGYVPEEKPQLKASFCVALKIAKEKKPHTIAETLIKPCAIVMVELMCGNDAKQKIARFLFRMIPFMTEFETCH